MIEYLHLVYKNPDNALFKFVLSLYAFLTHFTFVICKFKVKL